MDNQKEFVCRLTGNERLRKTQQAKEILDNTGVPYRFSHEEAARYGLHLYYGGLNICMGLDQIARFASRYKRRHSLIGST